MKVRIMDTKVFLSYLVGERNYSPKTVKEYSDDLKKFETYFLQQDRQLTWETIDADVARDWIESMMDAGNSSRSVKRRLSTLKSFYRFALSRGLVTRDPVHELTSPKVNKPLPQFVKEKEMNDLLDKQQWGNTYKDTRARTIILLFYETGIRLSELLGLNDDEVDFVNNQLRVTGKRNKQRIIPFGEELNQMLKVYMQQRDKDVEKHSAALFLTEKGDRVKRNQVYQLVKENLGHVTTLRKRSPHVLRHTFATAMLNHEAGLESVKKILGHRSLNTTEIYTHTTFEQLKKVYRNAHPRH